MHTEGRVEQYRIERKDNILVISTQYSDGSKDKYTTSELVLDLYPVGVN